MDKLKSRKLIVGVSSAILILVNDLLGKPISEVSVYSAIAVLGTYLVGQGIADAGARKPVEDTTPKPRKSKPKELVE